MKSVALPSSPLLPSNQEVQMPCYGNASRQPKLLRRRDPRQARREQFASATRVFANRHPVSLWSACCLTSGQVRAYGAFKCHARRIDVEQNIGVSRLDIDKAALFGDYIKQGNAAIAVGLPDDIQVSCGLVAHSGSVYTGPRLRSFVANDGLRHLVSEREINCSDSVACGEDFSFRGGNGALAAVECRQGPFHPEDGVVESLADGLKVSHCVEGRE